VRIWIYGNYQGINRFFKFWSTVIKIQYRRSFRNWYLPYCWRY